MLKIEFLYPAGGYLYYPEETAHVRMKFTGAKGKITVSAEVRDYHKNHIRTDKYRVDCGAGGTAELQADFALERLGYYGVTVNAEADGEAARAFTGIGVTTPYHRPPWQDSVFGMSANEYIPSVHSALFAKMGISYIRASGGKQLLMNRRHLRENGLGLTIQMQGADIVTGERYAPPGRNKVYHYQDLLGDYALFQEHGNEHWEEGNLMLLSEWHKSSGYARLSANPAGWFSNSGCAGVDINKLNVMYEQGVMDYITSISVHAYSFPMAPEQRAGFWSIARLEDLAKWMDERNITLPVAAMEQGYPALNGQKVCEVYSPGDLVTLDAQADYLVRSWLLFIAYGVSKVVWYNGPWNQGFAILEEAGPAPWPAAMALTELIRAVDSAEYLGNYEADDQVYYMVFRSKADQKLLGIVWRPVYLSRSSDTSKNYTFDGLHREDEGTAQELFDYKLHHLSAGYCLKDIMGNPVSDENGVIQIGERPVYIYGLTEDIAGKLTDKTIFKTKQVRERPLPPGIILGLSDAYPIPKAEYWSSKFTPGETRRYHLRVHNYTENDLNDEVVLELPPEFTANPASVKVSVAAGTYCTVPVNISCKPVAAMGEYKIRAKTVKSGAHPVYQLAVIHSPLSFKPLCKAPAPGDEIILNLANQSAADQSYLLNIKGRGIEVSAPGTEFTVTAGGALEIPFQVTAVENETAAPVFDVTLTNGRDSCAYEIVLPLCYIEYRRPDMAGELSERRQTVLTGYNLTMTPDHGYDGPSLIGNARPSSILAEGRMELDDRYLYAHFSVYDDTLVCVKNTRRNNVDSDGIWLRLYKSRDDKKPVRHFSIVPVGQTGNPEHAYVNEVSADIVFASPYTDYDYKNIEIKTKVYPEKYTVDVKIDRASVGLEADPDEIIADIRILDMNHDDWSKFYDTGKTAYKIIK